METLYTSVNALTDYVVCRLQRKIQKGRIMYILHLKTVWDILFYKYSLLIYFLYMLWTRSWAAD